MTGPLDSISVMAEVERIARSEHFIRSKRLIRFLKFTVQETLRGRSEDLSEYQIAIEAYDRPETFDPQVDAIIRNEAHRLRTKLNHYYETEGKHDSIVIKYRPGSYAPQFHSVTDLQGSTFLARAGEMGALIAAHDWKNTSLGPITTWPHSLKFALELCLRSKFQLAIYWGPELLLLYNDAEKEVLGSLHPSALGQPASIVLRSMWDRVGPMLHGVLRTGESTWSVDERLLIERHGYIEECYFTWSYSPITDDDGVPAGVLLISYETTQQVLADRRRRTLRELSLHALEAESAQQACRLSAKSLGTNPFDVPFACIYLLEGSTNVRLQARSGAPPNAFAVPNSLNLDSDSSPLAWGMRKILRDSSGAMEPDLLRTGTQLDLFKGSGSRVLADPLMVLPLLGWGKSVVGFLVAATNPRRLLDRNYKTFLELVAAQIASTVCNAQLHDEERERLAFLSEEETLKTEFLANLSRWLRRPVSELVAPLQNLPAKDDLSQVATERTTIELGADNLLLLSREVEALLMFTNFQDLAAEATYEPVNMTEVMGQLADIFRPPIEAAGLHLNLQAVPLNEPVYVNYEMWEMIICNLLSNALKFTFQGEIGIALRRTGPVVEILIWDTGEGISNEDLPHLFDRFHRSAPKRARSVQGLGMGMTLVRDLLALHAATIRVDSRVQSGTTFTIAIPPGPGSLAAERVGTHRQSPYRWLNARGFVQEAFQWSLPAESVAMHKPQPLVRVPTEKLKFGSYGNP